METVLIVWLVIGGLVLFGTGLLIGLRLGHMRQARSTRREAEHLTAALRQSQEELRQYQAQVSQHFSQTADLLQTLTADYRAVYEHLATGAQELCNGQVKALTAEGLREHLLIAPRSGAAPAQGSASQPASSLPEGQASAPEENHMDMVSPSANENANRSDLK